MHNPAPKFEPWTDTEEKKLLKKVFILFFWPIKAFLSLHKIEV